MLTQHPTTRPGISLIEAMIAIGVMAIGLLSLLTLFPLGALQIGKALKDDRCSEAALQADAYIRAYWKRTISNGSENNPTVDPAGAEPLFWAFDDPNLQNVQPGGVTGQPQLAKNTYFGSFNVPSAFVVPQAAASPISSTTLLTNDTHDNSTTPQPTEPNTYLVSRGTRPTTRSYPVLIDPIGWFTWTGTSSERWVAHKQFSSAPSQFLLPRRNLAGITSNDLAVRVCTLPDDMSFDPTGVPVSPLARQGKYTWAAIVQRSNNDYTNKSDATLTILVFDGRPALLPLADSERIATVSGGVITAGQTSLTITVPAATDPNSPAIVRRGGWIMDGTITQGGIRNAKFYRIAAVDSTTPNTYTIDLETPIEDTIASPDVPQIYLFEGLAEVFRRPPLE